MLSVSTSPAANESSWDPPPDSAAEASPGSTAVPVTVPQPTTAPMVFVGSSSPTVLLVEAGQVVTQPPAPSTAVSEVTGTTQLILKPAASPGSTPQDVPSPDSSTVSDVDSGQEKVWCLRCYWFNSVDLYLSGSNNVLKISNLK